MTTDFRALCAELINELHSYKVAHPNHSTELIDSARATLADEPTAPAPPGDGKVAELVDWLRERATWCAAEDPAHKKYDRAAELLQRQAPVPEVGE